MTKKTRSNPLKNPKIKTTKPEKLFKPGPTPPAGCTCDPFEPDVEHQENCALSQEEFPPIEPKPPKREKGCTCENLVADMPHEFTCALNLCMASKPKPGTKKASHDMARQAQAEHDLEAKAVDRTGKLSMLDAAHFVLTSVDQPTLNAHAILDRMTDQDLWTSPRGKTPANTLAAAIGTEIKNKGEHSRFVKVGRGLFKAA